MTANEIINNVATFANVTREQIFGKSRKQEIVFARHAAICLVVKHLKLTNRDATKVFRIDRSSVSYALNKSSDPYIERIINAVEKRFGRKPPASVARQEMFAYSVERETK